MYIYKLYKSKKDLELDIQDKKLHEKYIFCLNNSLYRMLNDENYLRISYFEYPNNTHKNRIEKLCKLKYKKGDIIKITGEYANNG